MQNLKYNIAVVSPSEIIKSGMACLFQENPEFRIQQYSDFPSFYEYLLKNNCQIAIIDSSMASSFQIKINEVRKANPGIQLILLVYQYVNSSVSNLFDGAITIDQPFPEMLNVIRNYAEKENNDGETSKTESLSDRETDVLKLLVTGFSAKEVADKLSISVNTVITHRKNISAKTGIKSLAGLTIYAVTRKIISMKSIN